MAKDTGMSQSSRGPVLRWTLRILKILAALFVLVHLYTLALKWAPVPGTILMGQRIIEGEDFRRVIVPLEEISPNLVYAVIAAEDARFCEHDGIDFEAVGQALEERRRGRSQRGASTITQQTAKNTFFWNGGGFVRKGGEAWFAIFIDGIWGKRRVMEQYLNTIEWGDGIFGAEAAARVRFGKHASELTEREAALLAAVLPNPHEWRVDPPGNYVSGRAGTLQSRLRVVANDGLANCVL
ncbi:monofunctional biosynthetic peptidoglycan transglycosylase [Henriciella algicola]|uniref:Biosynthetic peptidoglycan transglycosylase n=1 Tax=Henriciella algicola TaxID=1608422 RepID=A0A399RIE1_9PROT|nr:monofunctional biosynthetic peptidoglycan transglycosylase [Henriciella algicola]RIJ31416.1 monofunctional biosynthetic peptidoglycan transglycosylase [Henriciella algicola]